MTSLQYNSWELGILNLGMKTCRTSWTHFPVELVEIILKQQQFKISGNSLKVLTPEEGDGKNTQGTETASTTLVGDHPPGCCAAGL